MSFEGRRRHAGQEGQPRRSGWTVDDEVTRLTLMPNCFIEETYQKRWNKTWAVAIATCGLDERGGRQRETTMVSSTCSPKLAHQRSLA